MHIHLCTTIGAPVDHVWATVEDIATHTQWMADAESIEFVTDQRRGVGTAFDCRTRVGPLTTTDRMRVTEWEPGAVMGIEHHGSPNFQWLTCLPRGVGGKTGGISRP